MYVHILDSSLIANGIIMMTFGLINKSSSIIGPDTKYLLLTTKNENYLKYNH